MSILDYFGKHVIVKTDDNKIFIGFVTSVETVADSDDGIASIDIEGTKQFPNNFVTLKDNEIVDIKEQTTN